MIAAIYFFAAATVFGAALIAAASRWVIPAFMYLISSSLFVVAGVMQLISEGVIS